VDEVDQALSDFFQLPIILISSEEHTRGPVVFAREYRLRPLYDSLYAILAESLGVEFWTNDQRFIRRVQSECPMGSLAWGLPTNIGPMRKILVKDTEQVCEHHPLIAESGF
jgi:predicted nucleic acid-binding protein